MKPMGLFTQREGDLRTRNTRFVGFTCRNFAPLWLTVEKELKIKDDPLNDPPPFLCGLSLALRSSQRSSLHGGCYDLPTSQLGRS